MNKKFNEAKCFGRVHLLTPLSKISKNEKTEKLFLICKDVHLRQVLVVEMKVEGLIFTYF